jgi:hypothetical protein
MKFFTCKQKTGFVSTDELIKIFDSENKPFYVYPNKTGVIKFNLPKGAYSTNNKLAKLPAPVFYILPPLPIPTVKRKLPKRFKIVFKNNPNKCSVYHKIGLIVFDNSFKDKPKFFLTFIKLHELGHYFYSSKDKNPLSNEYQQNEIYCDTFARNKMLKLGYNPAQIQQAINLTLTQVTSDHRKQYSQSQLEKSFKNG